MAPLTISDVQRWDPAAIGEVFRISKNRAGTFDTFGTNLHGVTNGLWEWDGEGGEAFRRAVGKVRKDIDASGHESTAVANAIARAQRDVADVRKQLNAALTLAHDLHITYTDEGIAQFPPGPITPQRVADRQAVQLALWSALGRAATVDEEIATAIRAAVGDQMINADGTADGPPRGDPGRVQASAEAFQKVFGRKPSSPSDWETAEALNPNSYNPLYQDCRPEIRVVRIRPVPGQGVVRVSQYIEQRDVFGWPPGTRDFGNNRLADAAFDPENAKVTIYVDYETASWSCVRTLPSNSTIMVDQGISGSRLRRAA